MLVTENQAEITFERSALERVRGGGGAADRFAGKWNRLLNLRLLIVPGFRYFSRCIYFHLKNDRARDIHGARPISIPPPPSPPRAFYISDIYIPFDDVSHRRILSRSYYGRSFVNYKTGLLVRFVFLLLLFFFFFFNLLRWNDVLPRTSRIFSSQNFVIFPTVLSIYLSKSKWTKQVTNLLLLDHFYPVISCRRVEKESDDLLRTDWSLVMVRNQLPAQVVKDTYKQCRFLTL